MLASLLPKVICPVCFSNDETLFARTFHSGENGHIKDGILICNSCKYWFFIEDELLELVPSSLAYHSNRIFFFQKYKTHFEKLEINFDSQNYFSEEKSGQIQQREHYDSFETKGKISYDDFENLPFWLASDTMTFERWENLQCDNSFILDIGCGNGRSAMRLMNKNMNIVGIDISKKMLRKAIARTQNTPMHARTSFMVGDATRIPFRNESFRCAMTSGVMSNLPDVKQTCSEILRILQPNGVYFGLENNKSLFRGIFDFLGKIIGIWKNVKGATPEISHFLLEDFFKNKNVNITSTTSIFLPPNIFNLAGNQAKKFIKLTNNIFYLFGLKNHGGLIIFEVRKNR